MAGSFFQGFVLKILFYCSHVGLDVALEKLHRYGENDGGILLGGDHLERLEVAELEGGRGLADHVRGLLEGPGGLLFPLRRYHLGPSVPSCFRFRCHGSLHVVGQSDVLPVVWNKCRR